MISRFFLSTLVISAPVSVLVTALTYFYVQHLHVAFAHPSSYSVSGFPLYFYTSYSADMLGVIHNFIFFNAVLDFVFWFVVFCPSFYLIGVLKRQSARSERFSSKIYINPVN